MIGVGYMLGVLIVDDETIIRYGIKSMIDWGKLGLVVVGTAANGQEALEIFHEYKPEIVITDIKMPVMDGIELIRRIRQESTETKVILLTCLQDFNYAREAISMGVTEYFVKSDMMPADMEAVLKRVKNTIVTEHNKLRQINEYQLNLQKYHIAEKKTFLKNLSMGEMHNVPEPKVEKLNLGYLKGNLYFLCVGIDYYEKFTHGYTDKKKQDLDTQIISLAENFLSTYKNLKGEVFNGKQGEINLIIKLESNLSNQESYKLIHTFGIDLLTEIRNKTKFMVTAGVSNPFSDIQKISVAYRNAQTAYNFKIFFGCGRVIHFEETVGSIKNEKEVYLDIRVLQQYIYDMRRNEVANYIQKIFCSIEKDKNLEIVNFVSLEMVSILSNIYSHINKNDEDILDKKREFYEQIKYFETANELKDWFIKSFNHLIDLIQSAYDKDKNVIAKALDFIYLNYNKNISLQTISDHVHLSKNYFVNLFKREMGETFVEHLTKFRIEKAKQMLKDNNLRNCEIANLVGFKDERYFYKVFKKMTGVTPTQYKKSNI